MITRSSPFRGALSSLVILACLIPSLMRSEEKPAAPGQAARSALPSAEERTEMAARYAEARKDFASAHVLVFPVLLADRVSREDAVQLAKALNEAKVCIAAPAPGAATLRVQRAATDIGTLWGLAREFRRFLMGAKIGAEYALAAGYLIDPEKNTVRGVQYVLCTRTGAWVLVQSLSEFDVDFRLANPETPADCAALIAQRLGFEMKPEE